MEALSSLHLRYVNVVVDMCGSHQGPESFTTTNKPHLIPKLMKTSSFYVHIKEKEESFTSNSYEKR